MLDSELELIKRHCPEYADAAQLFLECNLPTEHEAADAVARCNFLPVINALSQTRAKLEKAREALKLFACHESKELKTFSDGSISDCCRAAKALKETEVNNA